MSIVAQEKPKSLGRPLLWVGIGVSLAGIVVYMLQLMIHVLKTPWYVPIVGAAGAVMIFASFLRRPTVTRAVVLALFVALTALEWWFIGIYVNLGPYSGPVAVGKPFPPFSAERGDGTPFTQANLKSDQRTVIVFFRGWW
jgi:hypothetical protein